MTEDELEHLIDVLPRPASLLASAICMLILHSTLILDATRVSALNEYYARQIDKRYFKACTLYITTQ